MGQIGPDGATGSSSVIHWAQIHALPPYVKTTVGSAIYSSETQKPPQKSPICLSLYSKMGKEKQYWLLKTEPGEWSWDHQASNGGLTKWDGVKNKQAQKHLKSMKLNDLCFFYHSGAKARRVVGVVKVTHEWYSDEENDVVVDVKAVGEMRRLVGLSEMKGDPGLVGFGLFRQPRLSVVPVSRDVWERICELGGGFEGDGKDVDVDVDDDDDDDDDDDGNGDGDGDDKGGD